MKSKKSIIFLVILTVALGFFFGDKYARYSMYQLAMENRAQQLEIAAITDEKNETIMIETTTERIIETPHADEKIVNLNKADKSELMTLDGIGEIKALEIIAYREKYGGFVVIEELMNIEGIGEKTFEKNKNRLSVE